MSWFWSSGHLVDFDENKKNAGRKINVTPRKIPSPVFFHLSIIGIHVHLHSELLT